MTHNPTSKNETPSIPVGSKQHNPHDNDTEPHEAHHHRGRKDEDVPNPKTTEDKSEETDEDLKSNAGDEEEETENKAAEDEQYEEGKDDEKEEK